MIRKRGDKFVVTNKAGTNVLGTHASKEKAAKQLAAIEISKAKHMSENKSFKAFRNELNESEYREVLTGYPNRDIHCDGPVRFDDAMIGRVNAMLNAISRSTYLHPSEAFVKIKSRLNILMLDFPWTPYLWQGGDVGTVNLTVTRYGRVDGVDALTGEVRMDGKANTMDGFKEFTLVANIERAEDGLFRVTAKLQPMAIGVVEEDYQTPAREAEMKRKVEKHETAAQRGYEAKMTKTGKAAEKGRKQEDKHDAASRRLLRKDRKEQESSRTYGRGGKLVKSGSRAEVKEEAEQIDELLTPMRDKITSREIDKGLSDTSNTKLSDAQRKKAYARATRAQFARLRARSHDGTKYGAAHTAKYKKENERWRKKEKSVKEEVEQIEEMHKPGDTVKVPHKGKMVRGKIVRHDKGSSGKAAQHGGGYVVDVGEYGSITVPSHKIVKEAAGQEATAKKVVDNSKKIKKYEAKSMKEDAQQIAEAGAAKAARLAKAKERAGVQGDSDKFERASAVQKRIIARLHKKKGRVGAVSEELVGGQKKLDVNKNKRLDAQDFAMLRSKKKPMKTVREYLDMASGMALQSPAPGDAISDKSGKGKRFHKKALKSVSEAAKKPAMKTTKRKVEAGAQNVVGRQKAIKKRLDQHDMRW